MDEHAPSLILQQPDVLEVVGDYLEFGVVTLDPDLMVRGWNAWMQSASGRATADVLGHSLLELFPEIVGSPSEAALHSALEGKTVVLAHSFHRWVLPLPPKPGLEGFEHMQQSVRIAPLEDQDGVRGIAIIIQDVTERVAGEQQLRRARDLAERASRAKSEFLAAMSHELRTPLTAIIGFGDLLENEVGGTLSPLHLKHAQRIKAGAWHLVSIIDEILTFSKLEAGRLDLMAEPIDLAALASDTAGFLEPAATLKGLELRVRIPEGEVPMCVDVMRTRQVLINLLGNAIKFTDRGWIELTLEEQPDRVVFCVHDTGPGIPHEMLDQIFEPFRQVEQSIRRTKGGTGLGLSVSRKLARLMDGDLEVETSAGGGATFVFWLRRDAMKPTE